MKYIYIYIYIQQKIVSYMSDVILGPEILFLIISVCAFNTLLAREISETNQNLKLKRT